MRIVEKIHALSTKTKYSRCSVRKVSFPRDSERPSPYLWPISQDKECVSSVVSRFKLLSRPLCKCAGHWRQGSASAEMALSRTLREPSALRMHVMPNWQTDQPASCGLQPNICTARQRDSETARQRDSETARQNRCRWWILWFGVVRAHGCS
jgi:hypothetical protein